MFFLYPLVLYPRRTLHHFALRSPTLTFYLQYHSNNDRDDFQIVFRQRRVSHYDIRPWTSDPQPPQEARILETLSDIPAITFTRPMSSMSLRYPLAPPSTRSTHFPIRSTYPGSSNLIDLPFTDLLRDPLNPNIWSHSSRHYPFSGRVYFREPLALSHRRISFLKHHLDILTQGVRRPLSVYVLQGLFFRVLKARYPLHSPNFLYQVSQLYSVINLIQIFHDVQQLNSPGLHLLSILTPNWDSDDILITLRNTVASPTLW